jgi:hypothetical protein
MPRRIGSNDYQPGDAIPPNGDILIGRDANGDEAVLIFGIAFVTREQARVAQQYGWVKMKGLYDGDLVRVRR